MKPLFHTALALLALGSLAVFASPARAQDEGGADLIVKKDGSKQSGKITAEDIKGLKVLVAGTKAELGLAWAQVKSVNYNPEGSNFNQAKGMVEGGVYEDAIKVLEDLKSKADLRAILKPHVLNYLGTSYYRLGEFDKATSTLEKLFADFPKTHLLIAGGGETLVNCYLARDNAAGAKAALDKLTQSGGADASLSLNILKGRVAEKTGDFSSAMASYNVILSGAADDATKAGAELGIARCLQGQKKPGEAQAKYKALVGKDVPGQVLAGAWNGLASITYDEAVQKKDVELMSSAMFQYMRGYVLYAPLGGEATTEYERAMRGTHDCFQALSEMTDGSKDPKKAAEKKYYAQKARLVLELLATKFPKSPYLAGK
jgi:tetratricopeptide (TPR) repeat protein